MLFFYNLSIVSKGIWGITLLRAHVKVCYIFMIHIKNFAEVCIKSFFLYENLDKSFNEIQLDIDVIHETICSYLFDKLLEPPTDCHFLAGIKQVLLTYCWLILRPKSRTHSYTCFTTLPPILLTLPPYLHGNVRHTHTYAHLYRHCLDIIVRK